MKAHCILCGFSEDDLATPITERNPCTNCERTFIRVEDFGAEGHATITAVVETVNEDPAPSR